MSGPGRVVVTGAGGPVGAAVVRELLATGVPTRATDRAGADLERLALAGAETVNADPRLPAEQLAVLQGAAAVIHAGLRFEVGGNARPELLRQNVETTSNLCRAALTLGIGRMVLVSGVSPLTESVTEAEQLCRRFFEQDRLPVVVLRGALIYGEEVPWGLGRLVRFLARFRRSGAPFVPCVPLDTRASHIHAADLGAAAALLARAGEPGEVYEAGEAEPARWRDLVAGAADAAGIRCLGMPALSGTGRLLAGLAEAVVGHERAEKWDSLIARPPIGGAVERVSAAGGGEAIPWELMAQMSRDLVVDSRALRSLGWGNRRGPVLRELRELTEASERG